MSTTGRAPRYSYLPIDEQNRKYHTLLEECESLFWTPRSIKMTTDADGLASMPAADQEFVKNVLAFFNSADLIVADNIVLHLIEAFNDEREISALLAFQTAMENIHARVYSDMITGLVPSSAERNTLFNALTENDAVKSKGEWTLQWLADDAPIEPRTLPFACVECLFFCSAFAAVYWAGVKLPGVFQANEYIRRDESFHVKTGIMLYLDCVSGRFSLPPVPRKAKERDVIDAIAIKLIRSAVDVERQFIAAILPKDLKGMNKALLTAYLEYVADFLLTSIGLPLLYRSENPFPFMNNFSLSGKTNFFEQAVTQYRHETATDGMFNDHTVYF